jgi:hypothetical protein
MLLEQKPYPFAKGLKPVTQGGRGWRPRDAWAKTIGPDTGGAGAGHWTAPPPSERADGDAWAERLTHGSGTPPSPDDKARAAGEALADPSVPPSLRMRVVSAVMSGGAFAAQVKDEIAEMVDDGRLSTAVGTAILRAIPATEAPRGQWRVGDTTGGSGAISSPPDDWGIGGTDDWGVGGRRPAMRDIAPPSDAAGFLYPPSGKSRSGTVRKMAPRGSRADRKLTRLERRCQLIATDGPFDEAPDMQAIERQIAREFELGLLAA